MLTQKFVRTHLKLGWAASDFAESMGCSIAEFSDELNRTFPTAAVPGIERQLKRNRKQQRRRSSVDPKAIEVVGNVSDGTPAIEITISGPTVATEVVGDAEVITHMSLGDLLAELEKIQQLLLENEAEHKSQMALKRAEQKALLQIQDKIKKLQEELNTLSYEALASIEKIEKAVAIASALNEEHQLLVEEKEKLEAQIRELETEKIFVHGDGTIEPEFEIEGWKELLGELITGEVDPALTVAQLQQVAKVVCYIRSLGDKPYVVVADDTRVQALLDSIVKED